MYKHKHNLLNSVLTKISNLNTNNNFNLRYANNYKKKKYNTSLKKMTISIMGPEYWNKFPNNLKIIIA